MIKPIDLVSNFWLSLHLQYRPLWSLIGVEDIIQRERERESGVSVLFIGLQSESTLQTFVNKSFDCLRQVMAEATLDMSTNMSPTRYYCHNCHQESDRVLSDFTCPLCRSGFVEEINPKDGMDTNSHDEDDQSMDILEHLLPDQEGDGGAARNHSSSDGATNGATSSGRPPLDRPSMRYTPSDGNPRPPQPPPTARVIHFNVMTNSGGTIDNAQSLEGLFQQILANMTSGQMPGRDGSGGGGGGVARGMINIDFPLPLFQVLHGNPGDYAWGEGGLNEIISQLLNQLDGSGPLPMPQEDIDRLPIVTITEDEIQRVLQCTVCMEDYKLGEKVRLLECSHRYHDECIVPWLKMHATCPVCRKELATSRSTTNQTSNSSTGPNSRSPHNPRPPPPPASDNSRSSNANYQDDDEYD
ncbi:E3 ubiquitin-protein ligase RNF115-like [Oppia nitens]|uniref:E3 ubiquitin-protein ligase RNF115-like n=1 Tax=Oppia nitens TaxID=1686743 RepID=UPI0023D9876C|nr:E3 ubiquitin-protein ligase RNF115-like [Oppia nitens]